MIRCLSVLPEVCRVSVADRQDCDSWAERINELRRYWLRRRPGVDFFTLGAATYLDASLSVGIYKILSDQFNPVLEQNFGDLFDRVVAVLEDFAGQDVVLDRNLALPGFHVFGDPFSISSRQLSQEAARLGGDKHVDSQYAYHSRYWESFSRVNHERLITFTMAIRLPRNGSGLNMYGHDDSRRYVPYEQGSAIVFDGLTPHSIPGRRIPDGDQRITLQAHGLEVEGKIRLFF